MLLLIFTNIFIHIQQPNLHSRNIFIHIYLCISYSWLYLLTFTIEIFIQHFLRTNRWTFCLRMREMRRIFCVRRDRRHLLFLNALRRVFKRAIYVVRKVLSREMKDYNNFTHISNTVDIHSVCRDFGWGYITPAFSVTCIGDIFVHLSTCHLSTGYVTWPTSKCFLRQTRLLVIKDGFIWHHKKVRSIKKSFCER